ncbi:MAG: aminotransferase class I/II-fold pyridoxal phosphate-dependent enzyme, partial [Planctomycetota bacterium]
NVVVCRSLSKAWGIAGARVGWMIGAPVLVDRLRSTGSPYALSAPAIAIACELLSEGRAAIAPFVAEVLRERDLLLDLCEELGLRAQPSEGNFVLVRCESAERLWRDLASLGIAVRRFQGRRGLEDALRITLPGDALEFERLRAALRTSQQPRALLFDMDGVLVDVSGSFRVAVLDTAASFGVPLSSAEVSARKAQGNANDDWELTRSLLEVKGVRATLAEVTERFEALYQGTEERPGLREQERPLVERSFLERLAKRLPLAVVTGRPRRDALHFLQREGLEDLFTAVICREDAALKPSPDPVRLACERLGVRSAWMIGDTPDDLTAAREAGVLPLAIPAPGEAADPLLTAGAARVLNSLEDLEGSF